MLTTSTLLSLRSAIIGIGNGERVIAAARRWMIVTTGGNIDASPSYSDECRGVPQHRRRSLDECCVLCSREMGEIELSHHSS
jgi:hypothetical protein